MVLAVIFCHFSCCIPRTQGSRKGKAHNKTKRLVCIFASDLLTFQHVSAALQETLGSKAIVWKKSSAIVTVLKSWCFICIPLSLNGRLACLLTCTHGEAEQLNKQGRNPLKLLIGCKIRFPLHPWPYFSSTCDRNCSQNWLGYANPNWSMAWMHVSWVWSILFFIYILYAF